MVGMIGHLGENQQDYGGEHFKNFSNLTSTWMKNSPLGGLDLWFVTINHDNDLLDNTFPTHTGTNYSPCMTFSKMIWRTGINNNKINGSLHYSTCILTTVEETDLSIIIRKKAAERLVIRQAALVASAPTNEEMENFLNWRLLVEYGYSSCLCAAIDNQDVMFMTILQCPILVFWPVCKIHINIIIPVIYIGSLFLIYFCSDTTTKLTPRKLFTKNPREDST